MSSTKVLLRLVDMDGKVSGKTKLFITARPALLRWTIKLKDGSDHSSYFRRVGMDEYLELTPVETMQILEHMQLAEVDSNELTINAVAEILASGCNTPTNNNRRSNMDMNQTVTIRGRQVGVGTLMLSQDHRAQHPEVRVVSIAENGQSLKATNTTTGRVRRLSVSRLHTTYGHANGYTIR